LESLLDRAEPGGANRKEAVSGNSRSKAAALRALKTMLRNEPELIYQAVEQRMQEDWSNMSSLPGASAATITARGWLEHRSRITNYQVSVRAAWFLAGVWDCLRQNRVAEARARCALGVACFDQSAVDKGSWLVSNELTLEDPPPFSSFAQHRPIEVWESPHTKLIDERWLELFLARLRDVADCQEKRYKLSASSCRAEEATPDKEKEKDQKGRKTSKGGKGKSKGSEEEKPAAAPPS
jgi:hypothetical protein